ncbi:MAG: hypothetical protein ACI914_000296 [Candidatus Marivariicella framensis]|jgi:hypothetical protein|tara:strand:- start:997 stop:1659 length:663 start_codon:yes stop_codon:yes gene_type:complete
MKIALQAFLWILSIFFSYQIYNSIMGPIDFNKVRDQRYAKVINRLKEIRKAQIAFKDVNGKYSKSFDTLIKFIDEGFFTLIEKRDSSYLQYDRTYRIDMLKEVLVIDTLGTVNVKDSLFKYNNDYVNMAKIPIDGVEAQFSIDADKIEKNSGGTISYYVDVFEVKVSKTIILYDQNKDLLKQENETISVDGVNGPDIILGSMINVSINGNWPTIFDASKN